MDRKFIIQRQGHDHVLYEGLLDQAHQEGLSRITTTLIQVPTEENGSTAIVTAEVTTEKGTYAGIGDASPGNVNRMIIPHLIRMAETRAKARALRDAVNIGVTAVEELGVSDDGDDYQGSTSYQAASDGESQAGERQDFPKASPYKPASANQLATIAKLSRLLGAPEEPTEDMTSADASERITVLSREYDSRKSSNSGRS